MSQKPFTELKLLFWINHNEYLKLRSRLNQKFFLEFFFDQSFSTKFELRFCRFEAWNEIFLSFDVKLHCSTLLKRIFRTFLQMV